MRGAQCGGDGIGRGSGGAEVQEISVGAPAAPLAHNMTVETCCGKGGGAGWAEGAGGEEKVVVTTSGGGGAELVGEPGTRQYAAVRQSVDRC